MWKIVLVMASKGRGGIMSLDLDSIRRQLSRFYAYSRIKMKKMGTASAMKKMIKIAAMRAIQTLTTPLSLMKTSSWNLTHLMMTLNQQTKSKLISSNNRLKL